jgi:hypothetical protein
MQKQNAQELTAKAARGACNCRYERERFEFTFKIRQKVIYAMTVTNMNETDLADLCLIGNF